MQRLLIVDDMPIIADGLADLFAEHTELELEVFRTYTAMEALDVLQRLRIDVVLTDIKMPGMSGIDLLKEIRSQWPRCKVIFLTSYDEFSYAREAMNLGVFEYVLKTEGDDRILRTVKKALDEIQKELKEEILTDNAREQFIQAKYALQRQYFMELLEGRRPLGESRKEKFAQLEIPLLWNLPVFLILPRLDGAKGNINQSSILRRFYSAQNVMEDCVRVRLRLFSIPYRHTQHIWLLQPERNMVHSEKDWESIFNFLYGNLETVQNICSSSFQLEVSFVISRRPCGWEDIAEQYLHMETLFQCGIGMNPELLTTNEELERNQEHRELLYGNLEGIREEFRISRFSSLPEYLNNGQSREFMALLEELNQKLADFSPGKETELEVYHYLASFFLSYINRWGIMDRVRQQIDISHLVNFDENAPWKETGQFFVELAQFLFKFRIQDKEEQTNHLVTKLQLYIQNNLGGDLSLTNLGELVHLNPSYLSRLYKQLTGVSLSDYIADKRMAKAKTLLLDYSMKIGEIAVVVGYHSGIAFTRFFKKMEGMTPQEYRDKAR